MGFKILEKNKIVIGGTALCCVTMVAYPEITASASKEAIALWLNSIVPVLLPFFIAANFLKETGQVSRLSPEIYPFLMGFLSGYPMGARVAGDYFREGIIDKNMLRKILSYSMITGPAFLIGAVGIEFLGSHKLGIIVAVSHYGGALINSAFYGSGVFRGKKIAGKKGVRQDSYYNILTDAILDSFRGISIILAYIMIFMIAADLLQFSGLLRFIPSPEGEVLIKGILEMTVGCSSLISSMAGDSVKATLAAFMVSFGGFSILGQSMSMLRNCDIRFGQLFMMKLSHGIISGLLAFSICCFVL